MSVPNQTPYNIYTANGLTTVFAYQFMIMNAGDIEVSINGTPQTSGYTVQGAGQTGGGQVVFMTPPANGSVVMLLRKLVIKRDTDYQDNGDLLAETINADFDRLWLAMQQAFLSDSLSLKRPLLGGDYNAGNLKIINLKDPTAKQDAATKGWVDLQYSIPTSEAKQAAAEAKAARDETKEIADKFGDVDTAVTEAQAARDISVNASGVSVEAAARAEAAKGATEAIANTNSTFPDVPSGIAGTTNGQYFRIPQTPGSLYSFKYYLNNAGTAVLVAVQPGDGAIAYVNQGVYPFDNSASWQITNDLVIFTDGTTSANTAWDAYFVPVAAGDQVQYFGVTNTSTAGELNAWLIQCDANKNYVKALSTTVSSGDATGQSTVRATATQSGFMYVRVRKTTNPNWNILFLKHYLVTAANLDMAVGYINKGLYPQSASSVWEITKKFVLFSGGASGTYNDWDAYYIPVKKGDQVEYFGSVNTATAGEINAWLIQCDSDKQYVSDLATSISTGNPATQGTMKGTAFQNGYIYVRVRNNTNPVWYINYFKKYLVTSTEVGIAGGVAEYDVLKAISDNGKVNDYTKNGRYYVTGTVILIDGTVSSNAGNDWLAFYIPVSAGDRVTMSGIYGSATVGQSMAYFIQLDDHKNFVKPLYVFTSTGESDVQLTRSATASQDGIMYVRVRRILGGAVQSYSVTAFQRSYKLLQDLYALQAEVDDLKNHGIVQTPFIGATLQQLPVKLDVRFNYNSASYVQDNVVKTGDYTFIVGTMEGQKPGILRLNNLTGAWWFFDLSTIAGNPLASPTTGDSHNVYSIGVTRDGYILVSGNMHVNACRAVISNSPYDISAWTVISYTSSTEVTYPRFIKYPDGTTQAFWRQGVSAAGQYFSTLFNDTTRTFGPVFQIAATDLNANAYEQRLGVGRDGSLHFCFGLRVNANAADANRGLFYAKSTDKGLTWTNAAGTISYPAPLTEANSEKIADIPLYTGYVNQCGGACDFNSRYHTTLWQNDENNHTQIAHIWFDGSTWQKEIVSNFDFKMDTSQPLLTGSLSRPIIGCTRYNKTWIFYRTTEMGRGEQIRAIDVSTPGAPVEHILAGFNAGYIELTINTDILMRDNNVLMLATRGAIGFAQPDYSKYIAETGYLMLAAMP